MNALAHEFPDVLPEPADLAEEEHLKTLLASRKFDPDKPPGPIVPVFSFNDVTTCTCGNLTTIDAPAKAGKTAILGGMMAATMKHGKVDTLGVSAENPNGLPLLHFDTEQSREDHWRAVDQIRRRAGLEKLPDWYHSYWLAGMPLKDIQKLIDREIAALIRSGAHSVFIDGLADLVVNVNDPAECNDFVARLHGSAIAIKCPIVGVIHQNPSPNGKPNKTRGHLGSQLERKSESNLTLEKKGEITTIWSLKQRRAPILKGKGPCFQWSTIQQMHVSCQVGEFTPEQLDRMRDELEDIFHEHPAMRNRDLETTAIAALGKGQRTIQKKLADYRKAKLLVKSVANLWEIAK